MARCGSLSCGAPPRRPASSSGPARPGRRRRHRPATSTTGAPHLARRRAPSPAAARCRAPAPTGAGPRPAAPRRTGVPADALLHGRRRADSLAPPLDRPGAAPHRRDPRRLRRPTSAYGGSGDEHALDLVEPSSSGASTASATSRRRPRPCSEFNDLGHSTSSDSYVDIIQNSKAEIGRSQRARRGLETLLAQRARSHGGYGAGRRSHDP